MSIIEHIYEALLDDEALNALPLHLAELVGARSAIFQTIVNDVPVHVATHYFSAAMNAYYLSNDVISLDPWIPIVRNNGLLNKVVDADDYLSRADFGRSGFYNEFFRRFGDDTGVSLGAVIQTREGYVGLGLHRALTAEGFGMQARAALQSALPHLRRLAETRACLLKAHTALSDLRALLHAQSTPVLLIEPGRRISFANQAAEAVLAERDGVECHKGRIRVAFSQMDRLDQALLEAAQGCGGDALLVPRPSGSPAYRLVVAPHRGVGAVPGQAMVLLEDPQDQAPDLVDRLRRLFGLSPAEADLAVRLSHGQSLVEIASDRAVQASTVRSQLNAVLGKTGSRRQSDLATTLARLPRLTGFE